MPIGITSPAKNLFLIGSTGASSTQDFLRRITPDGADTNQITPNSVLYDDPSQKMFVAGTQRDATYSIYEGFIYRTGDEDGTPIDYNVKLQAGDRFSNVFFEALCYDSDLNLYAVGNWDDGATPTTNRNYAPCLSKFNSSGEHQWTITPRSATGDLDQIVFKDVCADTYGNVYVTGFGVTDEKLHIAKYDTHGTVLWHKSYTDIGSNSFYGFAGESIDINSKDELIIVGTAFGPAKYMSVMVKVSTDGEFLWDKSIEIGDDPANNFFQLTDVHVDGNDQIYLCGHDDAFLTGTYESYVIKMTKEGNMLWQTKTNEPSKDIYFQEISVDTLTGQSIVAGYVQETNNAYQIIQRYSNAGNLIWTRKIQSPNNEATAPTMSSDPSYYYIAFADQTGGAADPTSFIFGKLSVTGSGLGDFQYDDGAALQDYEIISINTEVATLRDGSLRNDTSDFITYPFSPIKVVFGENAGGNLIYSDKKLQYETNDHEITFADETAASNPVPVTASDVVRDANLLLNYEFDNDYTYDNGENLFKDNSLDDRVDYNSTTNGNWAFSPGPTSSTVGPNVISPAGDLTGGTIVYDGTDASAGGIAWSYKDTAASADQNQVQFADGDVVTYSVYAKIGSSNNVIKGIYLRTYSPETAHVFFLDSGTKAGGFNENTAAAGISADIVDVGNGWYRCSITLNITANDEIGFQLYLTNAGGATGFNDASGAGDTIHAWGPQVERNSSAGRLIRTSGTAITASTTVINLTSSSYTGTINGATFNSAGYFDFDGTNDEIDLGNQASIITSGSFTVEAWAWKDSITTENGLFNIEDSNQGVILLSAGNNGANTQDYRFLVRKGAFAAGTQSNIEGNVANVGLNEWHHYVGVYDDTTGTATMFIDGVQVDTVTNASTTGYSFSGTLNSGIHIGPSAGRGRWHDGRIGEVRTYSRTLTATEVSQNFNATRGKYGV